MISLRERNRRNAMRTAQRTALDLFEAHGFDAVTVEQLATQAGMAASTIYRHFGTKEALVLWDEHDADLDGAFHKAFTRLTPWAALRTVFVDELGGRYHADLEFQLRRVTYLYATEQVHAAAVEADFQDREELTEALAQVLSAENREAAPLLAGAALLALDVAFDRWQQVAAARPLGELIAEAFDHLGHLDQLR